MQHTGSNAAEEVTTAVIKAVIIGAGVVLMIALFLATSVTAKFFRAYAANAFENTTTARVLWSALIGFVAFVLTGAAVAARYPATHMPVLYAYAGAFLLYAAVVQICDWRAGKGKSGLQQTLGELDRYVTFRR